MSKLYCAFFILPLFTLLTYNSAYIIAENSNINSRIVGGSDIKIQEVPYLVSLRSKKNASTPFEHRCAGAIYASSLVLTTATCVIGQQTNQLQIVAGTSFRTDNAGLAYLVKKYIIHPDFNIWYMNNDLAIVQLAIDFVFNKPKIIAPIPIAVISPHNGSVAHIVGWNTGTQDKVVSDVLQIAHIEILPVEQCKELYGEQRITAAMLCAGSDNQKIYANACLGDAGSPLVLNNSIVGLVSWGSGCATKAYPGVYTNLVHFKQWIESEALKL